MTSPRPPVFDHGAISDATKIRLVQLSPHAGGPTATGGSAAVAARRSASPPRAMVTPAGSGAFHVGGCARSRGAVLLAAVVGAGGAGVAAGMGEYGCSLGAGRAAGRMCGGSGGGSGGGGGVALRVAA
jgi:hypothetical protein